MNLTTPITITFTKQEIKNHNWDQENDFISVKVVMRAPGVVTAKYTLVLDKYTPAVAAVPAVMDGDVVVTPAVPAKPSKGQAQRLVVNPNPQVLGDFFAVQSYDPLSNTPYQNAKTALKQTNDIAALEAAGVADGWLMPAT